MDAFKQALQTFMAGQFRTTRKKMKITQHEMSELLQIDLRSYADLEHGKFLCCTMVMVLYLIRCDVDKEQFFSEIKFLYDKALRDEEIA